MAILQSWSQGVELWGEANMRKIWSAANVKVYGGGVAEEGFLRALSDLIGDYSYTNISISTGKTGSSRSGRRPRNASSTSPTSPNSTAAAPSCSPPGTRHPGPDIALVHRHPQGRRRSVHQDPQPRPKNRPTGGCRASGQPLGHKVGGSEMASNIGRFSTATPNSEAPAERPAEEQKPPELVYGSAEEFLHEQLLPTYVRDVDGRAAKWCLEWYFHPEALSRVEALWRAWEHLRLDGATGISVWFKDHADHHMNVLLDPRGPFYKCDMQKHRDPNTSNPKRHPKAGSPTCGHYLSKRTTRNSDGLYCPQSSVRYGEPGTPYKHSERPWGSP
ncbi:hypothetical protein AHiyo8_pI66760 (plasmid) [Arthrobacter sp. Hiyo8]|nr:hypothetical protein AHiyo8_pI66760 [Arthrobacter sp. Hiyo8]